MPRRDRRGTKRTTSPGTRVVRCGYFEARPLLNVLGKCANKRMPVEAAKIDLNWSVRVRASSDTANPFFTIGHSTRPLEAFVALLKVSDVQFVVDVRAIPRSRNNSQYNSDLLSESLSAFQIGYEHIATLGGLRGRQPNVSPATNAFWQNQSFHNFADYAMGEDFHAGFGRLRVLGHSKRCAIMCAETLWWKCHRRIISDYLIAAGEVVFHILGSGQVKQAQVPSAATMRAVGIFDLPG